MKHLVSTLESGLLDIAVANAEGLERIEGEPPIYRYWRDQRGSPVSGAFVPSSDWAIGGPIIERERIDLHWYHGIGRTMWKANSSRGPTPLIAAMRAYVASKLGDEVEL